ncbi:MAG: TonB-dependent receptor [Bacteroidetes bacterium]|nr:TonB-dependent receptor [Bacteroidota bacterium]
MTFPVWSQNGIIKGRVYNSRNNEAIPFANIIINGILNVGTTSDINGNYAINGVSSGYTSLVASSVGFEKHVTEDFMVTNVHPVIIDIPLTEVSIKLKEVEIKASPFVRNAESPVSVQTLSIQEIEKNPGANRDISKVIQALPGVSYAASFRNDVIVRGGGPGENRFYLDGVEIPNLNHFATQGASGGPVGIINSDFIREVDFYAGAFPADRGNALSSVIEFRQVDGNNERWSVNSSVGASDLALTLEGPASRSSSLLFSVRRSYLQFLFSALKLPFLPTYNDYQLKYKWKIDNRNQFTLISIGALDKSRLNTSIKNPDESQRYILGYLPVNDQWSYTIGGVYRHFRANGSDLWVVSRNMFKNRAYKYMDNIEVPENKILDYTSVETENKFRVEAVRNTGDFKITAGASAEYAKYTNQTFQKVFSGQVPITILYDSFLDLWKYGIFGSITRSVAADRLALSLGIRTDANNYSSRMDNPLDQLSPRFSASYSLLPQWYLNFNVGRYYQLPPYTTLGYRNNAGELVNKNNGLRYIGADHFVTGVEYRPDDKSKITLEGFYKLYHAYPLSAVDAVSLASKGADFTTYGDEEVFSSSRGRTYGLEFLFRDKDLKHWNILSSLTFVRSEFTDASGQFLPSTWDNKIIFNMTLSRKLGHNWDVGLKWRYLGSSPYTPYDLSKSAIVAAWDARNQGYLDYSRFNSLRLRAFHQLDIRVDKAWYFSKWTFMVYLDIQNLYNFKSDQPDFLVNYDGNGEIEKYTSTDGIERYRLRAIHNTSGTILPTLGIKIEI